MDGGGLLPFYHKAIFSHVTHAPASIQLIRLMRVDKLTKFTKDVHKTFVPSQVF